MRGFRMGAPLKGELMNEEMKKRMEMYLEAARRLAKSAG